MEYFNAVLLPGVDFRDRVVEYTIDNYIDIADGYCLSQKVYPHITLCQFQAEEPPMIFFDEVFTPVFTQVNMREGKGIHQGYSWIEWAVQKDGWLIQLQETVIGALESEGIKATTKKGKDFHPHMTFCRTLKTELEAIPLAAVEQPKTPWIFTIGSTDKNGQFLG